jgi:hypothetical protein
MNVKYKNYITTLHVPGVSKCPIKHESYPADFSELLFNKHISLQIMSL